MLNFCSFRIILNLPFMNDEMFGFEDLMLCKKIRLFKKGICKIAKDFPRAEAFRLSDQMIRSVRSINALIAEGYGRFTYPDQIHFCVQARGSLYETVSHLNDAYDEDYISDQLLSEKKKDAKEIEKMINGYLGFLRKKRDAEK